jgi:hypothetical protein
MDEPYLESAILAAEAVHLSIEDAKDALHWNRDFDGSAGQSQVPCLFDRHCSGNKITIKNVAPPAYK